MDEKTYPLAKDGVLRTVQGEGLLAGLPMVFVRLAGCSVGCPACDTDYGVHRRLTADAIAEEVRRRLYGSVEWCFITGGEPTDHDLSGLLPAIRAAGLKVAMVTSGVRGVPRSHTQGTGGVDHLMVSPHSPAKWAQRSGDSLNLVPGLNGLSLSDPALVAAVDSCWRSFTARYVTPMMRPDGSLDHDSLNACLRWVDARGGWRLGCQQHRAWRLP